MISGIVLLSALWLSANAPPAATEAAPADPAALIARLARAAPARTAYTEVRFVHLLRRPLVLHGQLDYGGADKLGKTVQAPYNESMSIDGGNVEVTRDGRAPRKFGLERAPELGALLTGFSALLGGDAATLQAHFTLQLVQGDALWTLSMTPRDATLARHLRSMVVDGAANEPRCFTLAEANGDSSTMLLGPLAAVSLPQTPTPAGLTALCRTP